MSERKVIVIGINGLANSGKDTFASYLIQEIVKIEDEIQIEKCAFASPLKQITSTLFGIALDQLENRIFKETILPEWGVTPRSILQFIGTELFRDKMYDLLPYMDKSFWVMIQDMNLRKVRAEDTEIPAICIYTDMRFQDEADWIAENHGYIVRISRNGSNDGVNGIPGHASEGGISFTKYADQSRIQFIANDGSLADLESQAKDFLQHVLVRAGIVKLYP